MVRYVMVKQFGNGKICNGNGRIDGNGKICNGTGQRSNGKRTNSNFWIAVQVRM